MALKVIVRWARHILVISIVVQRAVVFVVIIIYGKDDVPSSPVVIKRRWNSLIDVRSKQGLIARHHREALSRDGASRSTSTNTTILASASVQRFIRRYWLSPC